MIRKRHIYKYDTCMCLRMKRLDSSVDDCQVGKFILQSAGRLLLNFKLLECLGNLRSQ